MMRHSLWLLAFAAAMASAAELTVIRPKSYISEESIYYVFVDEQKRPVADLRNGERVTLQVPSNARSLAIKCPVGLGTNYDEVRLDFDFKANERAAGRLVTLPPGGRWEAAWSIEVFDTAAAVAEAVAEVEMIQANVEPVIRREAMT